MKSSRTNISNLPEEVLIKILSFLPLITAVQCSAVASPWRNLWHHLPAINFEIPESRGAEPHRTLRSTRSLVGHMLMHSRLNSPDKIPVQKFKVSFPRKNYQSVWMFLYLWLGSVINSKAVELDLQFSGVGLQYGDMDSDDERMEEEEENILLCFKFPYIALLNSSVEVLRLSCCELRKPADGGSMYYDKMSYYSLREIHLEEVHLETNEEIQELVNKCVKLEVLALKFVGFGKDCKIESKSLKVFRVYLSGDRDSYLEYAVEICAPKLESLTLCSAHDGQYNLTGESSLVEADVDFPHRGWKDFAGWSHIVSSLGGVQRLKIQNMWHRSLFGECEQRRQQLGQAYEKFQPAEEVFSDKFVFSNLKRVELLTGFSEDDIRGLEILLKKCPQLETMILVNKFSLPDNFSGVNDGTIVLQMPRLKLVEMKNFQKTGSELFAVSLLKKHATVLEKVVAYPKEVEGESSLPYVL